jgi:short-subunit dehydrogenase
MKGINSGIDVLINNAGIYIKEENNEKVVKETLATVNTHIISESLRNN